MIENGLSILQYADDTILFLDDDLTQAKNLKLILYLFEKLSGLKINFHKSEIFYLREIGERAACYTQQLFSCKEGSFPFKYLGIPMSQYKIVNKD